MSEMPFSLASSIVYFLLFYYPIGFQYASSRAGYFFAMFLVTEVFAVTLGQAVAALSPSMYIGEYARVEASMRVVTRCPFSDLLPPSSSFLIFLYQRH